MPGNAHVLAQGRDVLHIEFVEGDDAIDRLRTGEVADGIDDVFEGQIFGHQKDVVERFARPVAVAKFLDGKEEDAAAHLFAGAQEFLSFFVGADGEDGKRT